MWEGDQFVELAGCTGEHCDLESHRVGTDQGMDEKDEFQWDCDDWEFATVNCDYCCSSEVDGSCWWRHSQ